MVERMLADFHAAHRVLSVALRYFNAAGADPDVEIGEDHDPETHLVPLVLDATCRRPQRPSRFSATDYETPDGTCVRDYIHVTDLAKAHVLALKALERGLTHRAFNLGNGHGYSVREVIASVERVTGLPVPARLGERRPGDPARLISNSMRAASELQWRPRITGLDDIIATAWEWHKKRAQEKSRWKPNATIGLRRVPEAGKDPMNCPVLEMAWSKERSALRSTGAPREGYLIPSPATPYSTGQLDGLP